ncbi:hypothetical protein C5749_19225 [Sphingobacterium gobiense]|uniref:DUF4843 domain-containing protein n=2 Tax=Sphingobacterium gobiense TaxID=1382456 RepID=A0A2S9JCY8_9SPHI|nr:hypothetical protein C5749_19225 [Sphingobacterium gobiense]
MASVLMMLFVGCEDRNYPTGLAEYEHHYYIVYVPNNNSAVTVNRERMTLLELPVQFYSEFERDYNAVATYEVSTGDLVAPAVPAVRGEDFEIVDETGRVLDPVDGRYQLVFPNAKKAQAKIYVKLLNNVAATGRRSVNISLVDNIQGQFRVDIFSTAFKRTIQID